MEKGAGGSEEEEVSNNRIKETVMEILNKSNMDETTEFIVRKTASDNLGGIDLSTPHRKLIVRQVVQSFLDQQQQPQPQPQPQDDDQNDYQKEDEENKKDFDDNGDVIICKLSDKRKVTIQDFRGKTLVSLREYYKKDGKELPTAKGISLTAEQWSSFKKNVPAIEKAIKKMESRLN